MKTLLFSAIILLTGIEISIQQQKCHVGELQQCILMYTRFPKEHTSPFPVNEEQLALNCQYLQDVRNCCYNYTIQCMSELERSLVDMLFSSTAEKMKDFCNPNGDIYKTFVQHASCVNENFGGANICIKTALAATEKLSKVKPEGRIPFFCCALRQLHTCGSEHYGKVCSKDVAPLVNMIIDFGTSDMVSQICTAYLDASVEDCPELPKAEDVDGTYKENLIGMVLGEFVRD